MKRGDRQRPFRHLFIYTREIYLSPRLWPSHQPEQITTSPNTSHNDEDKAETPTSDHFSAGATQKKVGCHKTQKRIRGRDGVKRGR